MEMTGKIVGIDVSKDRLDVAVLPEGSTLVAGRDGKGLRSCAKFEVEGRVRLQACFDKLSIGLEKPSGHRQRLVLLQHAVAFDVLLDQLDPVAP